MVVLVLEEEDLGVLSFMVLLIVLVIFLCQVDIQPWFLHLDELLHRDQWFRRLWDDEAILVVLGARILRAVSTSPSI